jgi:hypothetical protein
VPQLAQLQATSNTGGPVAGHRVPLIMKDPEEPQLSQETPLPTINRCRHPALSPEPRPPTLPVLLLGCGLDDNGAWRPRVLAA